MRRRALASPLLFLLLLLLPGVGIAVGARPAAGQAVRGVVVDDQNLSRVTTATVRLVRRNTLGEGTETDGQGSFLLPLPGPGAYRLEVSRLGYLTTRSRSFEVEKGDTISVEFRVAPDAVLMDPITVTAHSIRGRNLFEKRHTNWGKGVFLTPQQIDSMHLRAPAEVFRKMKDVKLTWGWGDLPGGGRGPIPSVVSQQGVGCLMYMVNRVWIRPTPTLVDKAPGQRLGDLGPSEAADVAGTEVWTGYQLGSLLPEDVAAVEVYRSLSEVPPELRRYTHVFPLSNCGLVVFWTRSAW